MSGLRFAGYATLFERRDRGGDVITPGAFAASLGRRLGAGEVMPVTGEWQRLSLRPVRDVTGVVGLAADGADVALPVDGYAIDIDRNGDGWVRIARLDRVRRVRVSYRAGIAGDGAGVPEAIRHGIIRLAGEYYAQRDGLETRPPAAVSALWRPWRRMRLS